MTLVVQGGLLKAVVLNMLVVPALLLRYGVTWPGTAGSATPRRERCSKTRGALIAISVVTRLTA
jgi:hypothetical protein